MLERRLPIGWCNNCFVKFGNVLMGMLNNVTDEIRLFKSSSVLWTCEAYLEANTCLAEFKSSRPGSGIPGLSLPDTHNLRLTILSRIPTIPPAMAPAQIIYTVTTSSDGTALVVRLQNVPANGQSDDDSEETQTHTLRLLRERSTALIELSADGVTEREEVLLPPNSVVLVDFLPRVFGSVLVMYAVSRDKVVVLVQPYATGVAPANRPLAEYRGGKFHVRGGSHEMVRLEADKQDDGSVTADGKSGVELFQETLRKAFGEGTAVLAGVDQILPAHRQYLFDDER